jgi:hypothetical protein
VAARRDVLLRFAWPALADRLSSLFAEVAGAAADDDTAVAATS